MQEMTFLTVGNASDGFFIFILFFSHKDFHSNLCVWGCQTETIYRRVWAGN